MATAIALLIASVETPALASGYSLRFGPPAVGAGGSNPVNLPPTLTDTQISYVTDGMLAFNLSVTGLYFGKIERKKWGGFIAMGAGLVLDANGAGPGVYAAFGLDFLCGWVCLSMDYQQALGLTSGGIVSPFAWRLGVSQWF